MANKSAQGVTARVALSDAEIAAAETLRHVCNTFDGLDLKVEPELLLRESDGVANRAYLYYNAGMLVGFCTLDSGRDVEICGMVHPEHRRKGIGQKLLDAALDQYRRQRRGRALLICEDASTSGRGFVARAGGKLAFAEHRMALSALRTSEPRLSGLTLRQAGARDVDAIAAIAAPAFGDPEAFVRRRTEADMLDPNGRMYLALLDENPVGTLKVFSMDATAGIYGFAVAPRYQGQGIGRAMLTRILAQLESDGYARITLEVLTDNARAIALYNSTGFRTVTTYGYYALALR